MGIVLYHPERKFLYIFGKLIFLLPMIINLISLGLYLFDGADTFEEYINTIFFLSLQFICFLAVTYCMWNTNKVFKILNDFENIIGTSKKLKQSKSNQFFVCYHDSWIRQSIFFSFVGIVNIFSKTIYDGTEKKLPICFKIFNIGAIKAMPICIMMPTFIVSYFKYFTTDLGKDAFALPAQLW